jgi:hypothetical protein
MAHKIQEKRGTVKKNTETKKIVTNKTKKKQ